jgi:carbamoyltransferase
LIKLKDNGLFELNLKYFNHTKNGVKMAWSGGIPVMDALYSEQLVEELGPLRKANEPLNQYRKDIAASVQTVTEEVIFHILNRLQQKTGLNTVCIAGGVAQNSVANGKILLNTAFEKLYIPPAAHDAGTCIGAALWVYNQLLHQERTKPMQHAYFGKKYDNDYIIHLLTEKRISYQQLSESMLYDVVTDCLINEGVVGWFKGRAEFGPRALGHRSILADPGNPRAKDILNSKIKRRESFRPFAPSVLKEYTALYFEQTDDVPFMEKVFKIKADKRKEIPAVTHLDGTGRLQTVDRNIEPVYYGLINAFYQKTGTPVLLNTSFNENEPVVNSPEEALSCFLRTEMDMLVMEDIVITRQQIST